MHNFISQPPFAGYVVLLIWHVPLTNLLREPLRTEPVVCMWKMHWKISFHSLFVCRRLRAFSAAFFFSATHCLCFFFSVPHAVDVWCVRIQSLMGTRCPRPYDCFVDIHRSTHVNLTGLFEISCSISVWLSAPGRVLGLEVRSQGRKVVMRT